MKKNKLIGIISIIALVAVLAVTLVACGVPGNYRDGIDKMEAAGYDVDSSVSLNTSGTYLAFKAYGPGDAKVTVAYFPKSSDSANADKLYNKQKELGGTNVVKKKTAGNFVVVYFGTADGVKDFEK